MHDRKEYVIHIRNLKQGLNKSWSSIKPYININSKLRTNSKKDFEKTVSKLMNNSFLEKTMEYVTKNRDIKLVRSEARRN